MHKTRYLSIASAVILALVGCEETGPGSEPAPGAGSTTGGLLDFEPAHVDDSLDPADDPELQAMLKMPGLRHWRSLGSARYEPTASERGPEFESRGGKAPARFMIGMLTKRGHYVLEFDRSATSLLGPDAPREPADPGTFAGRIVRGVEKGWSDGTDNRVNQTGANVPIAVGRIGNCTGALIGSRIVRTAAHCLINHDSMGGTLASSRGFNYREDNTTWGIQTTSSTLYYGINYFSTGCGTSTPTDYWSGYRADMNGCTWADFGYLVLPTNWSNGAGYSWFGYRTMNSNDLGVQFRHGAYPVCQTGNGAPATCGLGWYFEDTTSNRCTVSSWILNPNKWYTGCDTSGGHSGGPVWENSTNRLIGHVQWEDCVGSTCTGTAPNRVLGHDQSIFDFQQWLRATYP